MKCYTSTLAGLSHGIQVHYSPQPAVHLGEEGRGRSRGRVALSQTSPPRLALGDHQGNQAQKLMRASPQNHEDAWVLATPEQDSGCLVRVKTAAVPVRGTMGTWETLEGSPSLLAHGRGAHGGLGQFGSWDDDLLLMNAGDVILVHPEGCPKTQPYTLRCTGTDLEQVV